MEVFGHPLLDYVAFMGWRIDLLKNVRFSMCYRNNPELLRLYINGSIDSGTLKKEIRRHQVVVVLVAHDPPGSPERLRIFFSSQSKPLRKFYAITDLFAIHSSDFLISGKQLHSWLHFKFHLIKKAFRVGQRRLSLFRTRTVFSSSYTTSDESVPASDEFLIANTSSEFLIDFQEYSST